MQIDGSPSEGLWTLRFRGEEKGWNEGQNGRPPFCLCLCSKSLFLQLLLLLAGLTLLLLMAKQLKLQPETWKKFRFAAQRFWPQELNEYLDMMDIWKYF